MFQFDEKIYQGKYAVKYVLETVPNCKKMLVVFSSFNRVTAPIQHTYNYMRTLRGLKCNKLFILDGFGPRGCYYMVDGMRSDVEDSVIALIDKISSELGLFRKDLISVGSSKGGSSALYYGMKYRFGSILSGAPQIRIADYVTRAATETADFMLGTPWTKENIECLNRKITDLIGQVDGTEINIISSKNDWQYQTHVLPFLKELDRNRVPYNLTMSDAVKDHNDIANHFPNYLIQNVLRIAYGIGFAGFCTADLRENTLEIENTVNTGGSVSCLYKLVSEKEQITYTTTSRKLGVNLHAPGIYLLTMNILFNNAVVYEQ